MLLTGANADVPGSRRSTRAGTTNSRGSWRTTVIARSPADGGATTRSRPQPDGPSPPQTTKLPRFPRPALGGAREPHNGGWGDGTASAPPEPCRDRHSSTTDGELASDRVGDVEEADVEVEALTEELPQRAHAEALGGVVAGGDEVDPVLLGAVHDPLAGLAGDVGVEARRDGLIETGGRPPGHDPDRGDHVRAAEEDLRLLTAGGPHPREQLLVGDRRREHPGEPQRHPAEVPERLELLEPEVAGEDGGVAVLWVAVEREVVGDQVEVVLEQQLQAAPERAHDMRRLLAAPEQAVVDEDGVRTPGGRLGEQLGRGRDAGGDPLHFPPPADLEAIDADVLQRLRLEQVVEVRHELIAIHASI